MNKRIFILAGLIAAPVLVKAQQPAVYYDFSLDGGNVNNLGSLGTDGLLVGGATIGTGGPAGGFSGGLGGSVLNLDGGDGSFVNTQFGADVLGFTTDNYTAAAWVRLNAFGGDSMIFGQPAGGGTFLHNGIRGDLAHMGHWGADTPGTTNLNQVFGAGNWFHMAFRYNGDEQSIYVNGFLVARSNQGNLLNPATVVIGRSENGGGLPGSLDDVAIYNSSLSTNQIVHLANGGNPNALPAPASGQGVIPVPNGSIAPAVQSDPGGWSVREVRGIGVGDLGGAALILQSGAGNQTNGVQPVINNHDPDTGGGGGIPLLSGRGTFLSNQAGVDDNDIAFLYRSKVTVANAGTYTFNVHSDDGFALRIGNLSWAASNGAGVIDPDDNRTLMFPAGTGDSNTRGQIFLPAGQHDIEFITWEGGGGAGHQLTYAAGAFANDTDTGTWRLLGTGPGGPDNELNIPRVEGGWTVRTSDPVPVPGNGTITSVAAARAALTASGTTITGVHAINYNDPQSGGPGSMAGDVPFPKDTGADDDDYAIQVNGILRIDVADTYRFGFQGDDGGYLRITGVGANPGTADNWTIVENATGAAIVADLNGVLNPEGDTLWTDVLTGNSRTVADVFLQPGDYAIESLFLERGGGSYFEVFVADPDTGTPFQLLTSTSQNVDMTTGTLVVPEPTSVAMLLGGFGALLGFQRVRRRK